MNSKARKITAAILCCTVLAGGAGAAVYAVGSGTKEEGSIEEKSTSEKVSVSNSSDVSKDETVYVIADAEGGVKKIIVSDWIKNPTGADSIADGADLTDVEAVKGDSVYTMNSDNMRIWNADGGDIYLRGNSEKSLPVELAVSYKLDGKSISADELAGKSGKVTVRFDYKNNQYETVSIDGKDEKIYVPFVMLTGLLLDSDVFTNIEVTNGRLINDGDRTAVIGFSLPGMQENLAIDREKLEIPDYVEITADVKGFEMTNTVTVASNSVFNSLDSDSFELGDDLTGSLSELQNAMKQLTDGSDTLYGGLCTLLDKSGELIAGIDKLYAGAEQLRDGAAELDDGAASLADGAAKLDGGLSAITANNDALNSGSKQVFESLLAMANSQIAAAGLTAPEMTVENYSQIIGGILDSLSRENVYNTAMKAAREKVSAAVESNRDAVAAAVSSAVREQVRAGVVEAVRRNVESEVLASLNMTEEQYSAADAAVKAQISAAVDAQMNSDAVKGIIDSQIEAKMNSAEIKKLTDDKTEEQISVLIEQNLESDEVKAQINAVLEKARAGADSINGLKAQLDSYNQFYTGLSQYTAGVAAAGEGAKKLNAGASELKGGTSALRAGSRELLQGVLTLKNGAPALLDGVTSLRDGSLSLSDGLREFNEKGIQKLVDAVDGDVAGLVTRMRSCIDVSKNYKSFSGTSDDMDGQVKFIYKTDSVNAD